MGAVGLSLSLLSLAGMPPVASDQVPAVSTRAVDLHYAVPGSALPLQEVALWIKREGSLEWQRYGSDDDLQPPIRFVVPDEGSYALFFVMTNAVGQSSGPPQPGDKGHGAVLADWTAPLVQIQGLAVDESTKPPRLMVRWSAFDANLPSRPVTLLFRQSDQPQWQTLSSDLANSGRHDWEIPATVHGALEIRVLVTDLAGNAASDQGGPLEVLQPLPEQQSSGPAAAPPAARRARALDVEVRSDQAREQAQQLYKLGIWHKDRGDTRLAIQRLLEAMNHDPGTVAAAYELAELYYLEGNYKNAASIYQRILTACPAERDALHGNAMALAELKRYPEALERLEQILATQPSDAATWLNSGDICLMMGRTEEARRRWREASKRSPWPGEVARSSRQRLRRFAAD